MAPQSSQRPLFRFGLFCPLLIAVAAIQPSTAQIRVLAVTDGAAFTSGMPDNGSLASVFCTGLTGIDGVQSATEFPLPDALAGVSVRVNGATAPLLAVADLGDYQQINIQVPVLDGTTRTLEVSQSGQSGQMEWAYQPTTGWGAFFTDSSGYAIAQHADGSLVTSEYPAQPGEVLVAYATNLGSLNQIANAPSISYPAEATPLPRLVSVYFHLYINGAKLSAIDYVGLTPGLAGVFQTNFKIPTDTPDGDATLYAAKWLYCYGYA